jgi:electron transport complex protein RnfA
MGGIDWANLLWIYVAACVVNNFTLSYFLGLCPFLGVSGRIDTALRMGLANIFVMTVTSVCAWALNTYVLPHAPYLRLISFIVVIASTVQFVEIAIKKLSPALFRALGIYLPLITTNCAVLGVAILNIDYRLGFVRSIVYTLGVSLGYTLAIVLFASVRDRVFLAPVPRAFQGYPIAFITASLMSLAFMGFAHLFGL